MAWKANGNGSDDPAPVHDGPRMTTVGFKRIAGRWAIVRLAADAAVPDWFARARSPFASITRTRSETSIVCDDGAVPEEVMAERDWALLELVGPFAFSQTGILAGIAQPLAQAGIPLFAISTFDTDYLLVASTRIDQACAVLVAAGHEQRFA